MKFGFRKPSLRKSIAARTSWKRYVRHSLGLKAPRGWGWLTNPRKAAYNRVYRRTTFGWQDLLRTRRRRRASQGCLVAIAVALAGAAAGAAAMAGAVISMRR
ncbi:MAG TPA: hypothetical protein VLJ39_06900 [Tepidisphaeraceae bacterium]|nr:hypothetical protein [Tepidisphaeraceae bacterium]